jgi:hypothetical protein
MGTTLVKLGIQVDADCALYGGHKDSAHILCCPDSRAQTKWAQSISLLRTWFNLRSTLPALRNSICSHLQTWGDGTNINKTTTVSWPGFTGALTDQSSIGWQLFMQGCISTAWKEIQHSYFKWLGRRNTGRRWAELLISKLLNISWDMWDHRNSVRHAPNNPRQRKARSALDTAVISELCSGRGLLSTNLWHFSNLSCTGLLKKSNEAKKKWLQIIEAGRRFALNQASNLPSSKVSYQGERDSLHQWIATGRY